MNTFSHRFAGRFLGALLLAAGTLAAGTVAVTVPASAQTSIKVSDSDGPNARRLNLGTGKSAIIELPRDAKEVFVANPAIANAVVRSARKVFVIAVAAGQTSLFFMDGEGKQIAAVDVNVQRDVAPIRAAIKKAVPRADVEVEALNDGILLTGNVSSQTELEQVTAIVSRYVGKDDSIANSIAVRGRDQVMLKVTVAEVQRQVLKQLGVNTQGTFSVGSYDADVSNVNPFPVNSDSLGGAGTTVSNGGFSAQLRAFERSGVVKMLAEPTLTAVSGESAKFVAGGDVPMISSVTCSTTNGVRDCTKSVERKSIGVTLNFTPVVLGEGRISLRVANEVSDLDYKNPIVVEGITIPSINVRKADTTVELPSGGSLIIAGMLQETTKQVVNGTPGLMNLPILGQLFRSRDYMRNETELMIMVTPYLAKSIERNDVALPTDGFADASDPSAYLLGRINRLYGAKGGQVPNPRLNGQFGFIID